MSYFIEVGGQKHYYASQAAAKEVAKRIHDATGIVVGIEQTPRYATTSVSRMSEGAFVDLIVDLIVAAQDNFDGLVSEDSADKVEDAYKQGAMVTLGHQIACLIAQRYNIGVGTTEATQGLDLFNDYPDDLRREVVVEFLAELQEKG